MAPKSTPQSWNAAYGHVRRGPRTEFGPGEKLAVQHLAKRVPLGAGVSVIELGGGGGSFLLPFARLGCSCYSFDFSDAGLSAARELFSREGHKLETISGDLMKLDPQLLARFDVVVSYGLCEHFRGEDRTAVVSAHAQLMKPGGASLISVPNRASPFYQLWWAAARFLTLVGQARRFDVNIVDEWAFTRGELTRRCREAGLDDVVVIGTPVAGDFIDMLARPIVKFLRRLGGRDYRRPPRAHAFRSPIDDPFGSYLYCVAAETPAPVADKNSSRETANRRADQT